MFSNNNDNDNNNNNIPLIVGVYTCDDSNILTCKRCEKCINQLENSTSPYPTLPPQTFELSRIRFF